VLDVVGFHLQKLPSIDLSRALRNGSNCTYSKRYAYSG
jgi:hypothetical protein